MVGDWGIPVLHKHVLKLVVVRVRICDIWDMALTNRTYFYLTWTSRTLGTAYGNMFTLVVKYVRSRIVAHFTDSYDKCKPGLIYITQLRLWNGILFDFFGAARSLLILSSVRLNFSSQFSFFQLSFIEILSYRLSLYQSYLVSALLVDLDF